MSDVDTTKKQTSSPKKKNSLLFLPFLILGFLMFAYGLQSFFNPSASNNNELTTSLLQQSEAIAEEPVATSVPATSTIVSPTPTETALPTATALPPTATPEPLPTNTPEPVQTPAPLATTPPLPTAVPEQVFFDLTTARLILREFPTAGATALLTLTETMTPLKGIGRNTDGSWMQIQLNTGQTGWVSGQYTTTDANPFALLPIVDPYSLENEDVAPVPISAIAESQPAAVVAVNSSMLELAVPRLVLREEPWTSSTALMTVTQDMVPPTAIGRNDDATWLKVQLESGQFGWMSADFLIINIDPFTLPIPN